MHVEIPPDHPRAESLRVREKLAYYWNQHVLADAGLIAHGRGEAFDYLIGERTIPSAREATTVAAAHFLLAKKPVISVNGNAAALASTELVKLAEVTSAQLEVNLFYRTKERMQAIGDIMYKAGANKVLGLDDSQATTIPELSSERRIVDRAGIFTADVVLVPLEDGDRTEALQKLGKIAIAIDLNPLSRTSQSASVTIVDNVVRVIPNMIFEVGRLRGESKEKLRQIVNSYDNKANLRETLTFINQRLSDLSRNTA